MKNTNNARFKKILSRVIYFSGINSLLRLNKNKTIILTYHRIVKKPFLDYVTKEEFEKQMIYLSKNYNVVSLQDYIDYKGNIPNAVIITFDDGYKDFYENAYPVLKRLGLISTIFVSTKNIGSSDMYWWDKMEYIIEKKNLDFIDINHLKTKDQKYRDDYINKLIRKYKISFPDNPVYLSWNDLNKIKDDVEIGCHTLSHPFLARLSYSEQKYEIKESSLLLKNKLNVDINSISFPHGSFNNTTLRILKELGFKCGCSNIFGLANPSDIYSLKRIGISSEDDFTVFKVKITGAFERIKSLLK